MNLGWAGPPFNLLRTFIEITWVSFQMLGRISWVIWMCGPCAVGYHQKAYVSCQQRPGQWKDVGSLNCKALRVLKSTGTTDSARIWRARNWKTPCHSCHPTAHTIAQLPTGRCVVLFFPPTLWPVALKFALASAFLKAAIPSLLFFCLFLGVGCRQHGARISLAKRVTTGLSCRHPPRFSSYNYCLFDLVLREMQDKQNTRTAGAALHSWSFWVPGTGRKTGPKLGSPRLWEERNKGNLSQELVTTWPKAFRAKNWPSKRGLTLEQFRVQVLCWPRQQASW